MIEYYINKANAYVALTDFRSAIASLVAASRLGKIDRTVTNMLHWLHYTVGQMMLEQRMYEQAIDEFDSACSS